MIPFDDTGATLTTDELAALPTGYPAGPGCGKAGMARFFCRRHKALRHSRLSPSPICC
jgi:hypothetical protein